MTNTLIRCPRGVWGGQVIPGLPFAVAPKFKVKRLYNVHNLLSAVLVVGKTKDANKIVHKRAHVQVLLFSEPVPMPKYQDSKNAEIGTSLYPKWPFFCRQHSGRIFR